MRTGYKNKFTRKFYSRGAMQRRDRLAEKIDAQDCEICCTPLKRKIRLNGSIETISAFVRRRTCGMVWSEKENKLIPGKCMKEWRKIPTNNGMYKGVMHRACTICGKDGLSYASHGNYPIKCKGCYLKTREITNRREDEIWNCDNCGKSMSDRWSNGRTRQKNRSKKHYCSKSCSNYVTSRQFVKNKVEHICLVCSRKTLVFPSRLKAKKTCSLSCNGKLKLTN